MKLAAYTWEHSPPPLVAAPPSRDWMDEFTGHHAYKCLPLSIANSYGWQILCPADLTVRWTGGMDVRDVAVETEGHWVESNFARGVVTFLTGYIFQTPPGLHLMASGPTNWCPEGVMPMTGVMETDWLPYPFTMNWRFLRPGAATWRKGDPFCQIWVIQARLQETMEPEIMDLGSNPELKARHDVWATKRTSLRTRLSRGDLDAVKTPWDRDYFVGRMADGGGCPVAHMSKLRVPEPVDRR